MWDLMLEYTSDKQGDVVGQETATTHNIDQPETPELDDSIYKADILFVATNLDSFDADDIRYGYELMVDLCYRQIDAPYYAYLRQKMTQAKKGYESGKIQSPIYEELRQRFNTIHAWAMEHIGEQTLQTAIRNFDARKYVPPSEETYKAYRDFVYGFPAQSQGQEPTNHLFPQKGNWLFTKQVSSQAIKKVDTIRYEAMKLGWTQAGLYQNRGRFPFPYGQDYGLVCFLSSRRQIGKVTTQYIEIVTGRDGIANRFYNSNGSQPWITARAKRISPDDVALR